MPERIYFTRRLPAAKAISKVMDILSEVFTGHIIQFSFNTDIPTVNYSRGNINAPKEILDDENFKRANKFLLENEFANLDRLSVKTNKHHGFELIQGHNDIGLRIRIAKPDNNTRFELDDNPNFENTLVSKLHTNFLIRPEIVLKSEIMDETSRRMTELRESQVRDLESIVSKLVSSIGTQAETWNTVISEKLNQLEQKYQAKEDALDEKFQNKERTLQGDEHAFNLRKKEFDERENRVVRRDLLKDMRKLIDEQKTFSLSADTQQKRGIIGVLSFIGMGSAAALVASFVYLMYRNGFSWHYMIPITSGTLFFVSTFVYMIRWNSQWFQAHADAEIYNKKFSADILRASWVAELFFEWKEKKEFDFPVELMKSLTVNLFTTGKVKSAGKHPVDDLIASVGKVSRFKLGKGTIELESNPNSSQEDKD